MPIRVMTVPVTTGGKKRTALQKTGAAMKPRSPATMTAPKMTGRASDLSSVEATIAVIGATPAKVTPLTNGSRAPIFQTPMVCRNVARPAVNRQAPVRKVRSVAVRPMAAPTIRGGATTPAYIAATCWRPVVAILSAGSFSSTGWSATAASLRSVTRLRRMTAVGVKEVVRVVVRDRTCGTGVAVPGRTRVRAPRRRPPWTPLGSAATDREPSLPAGVIRVFSPARRSSPAAGPRPAWSGRWRPRRP
ncbi:hypothetical protein SVIOM74S_00234 [Streptomyces violarus]